MKFGALIIAVLAVIGYLSGFAWASSRTKVATGVS
jgi:hypothetical protein